MIARETLADWVRDARQRTRALIADLNDEQLMGPRLPFLSPLRWELGHLAWLQEKWVLRRAGAPSLRDDADLLYDAAAALPSVRWDLPLPSREETLAFLDGVEERILELIQRGPAAEDVPFLLLAVFHEDLQSELFLARRQTLAYPAPPDFGSALPEAAGPLPGDVQVPGGTFLLGAPADDPFAFDNEKGLHPVEVQPFAIARAPVTQGEFQLFVDRGGYHRPQLWCDAGWHWRRAVDATCPLSWKRATGSNAWLRRHFDTWVPLEPHQPMLHVNWYEAQAYCRWVQRRLPTEVEWEAAAAGEAFNNQLAGGKRRYPWGDASPTPALAHADGRALACPDVAALPDGDSAFGCRQLLGTVWEWTFSDFGPYPGFTPGPEPNYSAPFFGTHKVLRGGCLATRSRLLRNTLRRHGTPDRRDLWTGFRTCALHS